MAAARKQPDFPEYVIKSGFQRPKLRVRVRADMRECVCVRICASVRVLALARRGRLWHVRVNVQATRVTSSLLALVCQVSCDLYCTCTCRYTTKMLVHVHVPSTFSLKAQVAILTVCVSLQSGPHYHTRIGKSVC